MLQVTNTWLMKKKTYKAYYKFVGVFIALDYKYVLLKL